MSEQTYSKEVLARAKKSGREPWSIQPKAKPTTDRRARLHRALDAVMDKSVARDSNVWSRRSPKWFDYIDNTANEKIGTVGYIRTGKTGYWYVAWAIKRSKNGLWGWKDVHLEGGPDDLNNIEKGKRLVEANAK
jgi:hypothetical protein